jgi:membrane-associated phospholipid phosphatase
MIDKILLAVGLLAAGSLYSQTDSSTRGQEKIYKISIKYELPAATAGLVLFSTVGLPAVIKNAVVTEADLAKLDPADVHWFDRPVIFNQKTYSSAISSSDIFLNSSLIAPVLLALDKKLRKDWIELVSMYLVTHAINNTIFLGTVSTVHRVRPLVYNTALPVSERTGDAKSNSFYSGHVANAAASTFFIVKVFTDYHHIKGWKRIALYSAAAVPPVLIGNYRMRAGRHFRSDVIAGFLVGATCGIVVPELHRIKKQKHLSIEPFYSPQNMGVTFRLTLGPDRTGLKDLPAGFLFE